MTYHFRNWLIFASLFSLAVLFSAGAEAQTRSTGIGKRGRSVQLEQNYGKLPLAFEMNQGQTDGRVKFLNRGLGSSLFLTSDETVLEINGRDAAFRSRQTIPDLLKRGDPNVAGSRTHASPATPSNETVLGLKLVGSNADVKINGEEELPGRINYLLGNDPSKWRVNVPTFAKVQYRNIYPGIDVVYYGNVRGRLEHDFIVHPGADIHQIEFALEGTSSVWINRTGDLKAMIGTTAITLERPMAYQVISGKAKRIKSEYQLRRNNRVKFSLGWYDPGSDLVIDPVLAYSTFLSSDLNIGLGIAADAAGNAFVVGTTQASNFPTTQGVFESTCPNLQGSSGCYTPFVTKLSSDGSTLLYSTYLGGTSYISIATAIALDSSGNAYLTGYTADPTFPVTANAFQSICGGYRSGPPADCGAGDSAFISVLNLTGTALLYSTYLSGGHQNVASESGTGIAVDSTGNFYASGSTTSPDFPTLNGFQTVLNSGSACGAGSTRGDLYLVKFSPITSTPILSYSTFVGGSGEDDPSFAESAASLAIDNSGDAYMTGSTASPDFPVSLSAYSASCGADGNCNGYACSNPAVSFVTKVDTTKSGAASLIYSTYLGGSTAEYGVGVAADNGGHVYATGWSQSSDFPSTPGSFESCNQPFSSTQSYVTKLDTNQSGSSSLVYSGCVGEDSGALTFGVKADSSGNAYVAGAINSPDRTFTEVDPIESQGGVFATALSADGSTILWSTRFGSTGSDQPFGAMTLDNNENIYVTGSTYANGFFNSDFPTTAGSYSPTCDPNKGCSLYPGVAQFIAKISESNGATAALSPWNPTFAETDLNTHSSIFSLPLRDMGDQPFSISSITVEGANASDFSQTNNCPVGSQLSAASQCTVSLTFTPTATGTRSATVTVTDTAPGSPHVATMTGTGDNISFAPASLTFPATSVGQASAAKTITLTNVATARILTIYSVSVSGNFTETDTCAGMSLAPNASCNIDVTFMPTVQGPTFGSISVTDSGTSVVQDVSLSGTGSVGVSFSPASLSFGTVPVGTTSASKTVIVSNNLSVGITNLAFFASGDYNVVAGGAKPCTNRLAVKASCTVNVTFSPTTNGSIKGDVAFSYSGGTASPQMYTLAGSGTGGSTVPLTFSPTSLSIVNPVIGSASAAVPVTVTNVSASALTINSLTTNGNFSASPSGSTPCTGTLNAGIKCTFSVTFTPPSPGTVTGAVTITDSSAVAIQTYGLSGNSLAVSLAPVSLTFPSTSISGGSSGPLTVTVTNNQNTSVTLNTFTASGDFSLGAGTCSSGIVLPKRGKCTLQLFFTPTVIGTIKGALTVTHTASGSPQEVSLSGTGIF